MVGVQCGEDKESDKVVFRYNNQKSQSGGVQPSPIQQGVVVVSCVVERQVLSRNSAAMRVGCVQLKAQAGWVRRRLPSCEPLLAWRVWPVSETLGRIQNSLRFASTQLRATEPAPCMCTRACIRHTVSATEILFQSTSRLRPSAPRANLRTSPNVCEES